MLSHWLECNSWSTKPDGLVIQVMKPVSELEIHETIQ